MVSRSGAFVFYLGDRYFGTVVAYVAGADAAKYKFTSALTVQVLKVLAPTLMNHLDLKDEAPAFNCKLPQATAPEQKPVSYTHLTLPTNCAVCRSRWSPYH